MPRSRRALCVPLLLAALVMPTLSGCASMETPGAAAVQAGVVGEFVEQLKREDDEAEVEALAAMREARQEQHERAEEVEVE